jgi:predicted transcriptional regulator
MDNPPDNSKHPDTQALIVKAIEVYGLTQIKIADLCEVHQSVVSGWKSGSKKARWKQVRPLIEKYGDVQNESKGVVYCRITNPSYIFSEESIKYLARAIRKVLSHQVRVELKENSSESISRLLDDRITLLQDIVHKIEKQKPIILETIQSVDNFLLSFNKELEEELFYEMILTKEFVSGILESAHRYDKEYVKIYGDMIFDYIFSRKDRLSAEEFPWMKWSVISTGNGHFVWIISKKKHIRGSVDIDQKHEHATWLSEIHEDLDAETIMNKAKGYKVDPQYEEHFDRDILLFSLVHALSQNGYELECVSTIR